jgi:hypothetical protein
MASFFQIINGKCKQILVRKSVYCRITKIVNSLIGTNYIMYSIFVYQGAGCISSDSFSDSLVNYDGQSQKYGDYSGFSGDVCLVASNLYHENGYCRIIAWWN